MDLPAFHYCDLRTRSSYAAIMNSISIYLPWTVCSYWRGGFLVFFYWLPEYFEAACSIKSSIAWLLDQLTVMMIDPRSGVLCPVSRSLGARWDQVMTWWLLADDGAEVAKRRGVGRYCSIYLVRGFDWIKIINKLEQKIAIATIKRLLLFKYFRCNVK